ncbi:hypothetical protein [Caloramator australicus]|uniref:Uncharacterized protein n=1 Tax=Caloramator australicus RC3 TaxID=857293 RepID=I7LFY7_9CLOT|nr:hypothetical protein [Caloramator australicus]CCJ32855.1 hypothetical protein CAAU_0771 [Caloramator australicus RC3]
MELLIHKVKEIKEISDITEVNTLIEKDWILLKIVPNKLKTIYVLGRIEI